MNPTLLNPVLYITNITVLFIVNIHFDFEGQSHNQSDGVRSTTADILLGMTGKHAHGHIVQFTEDRRYANSTHFF